MVTKGRQREDPSLPPWDEMPSSSAPTKRRKATRLLTSSTSKLSVTLIDALTPLILLRLAWKSLLQGPTSTTLTVPLLPSIFIIQSAYIILLLPFNPPFKPVKKRVVKMDTLGEALTSKAGVKTFYFLTRVLMKRSF